MSLVLGLWLCAGPSLMAARSSGKPQAADPAAELKRLTIEELANLDVSTPSRRPERWSETAAAISVVSQEDLRRSGATTLAEALRLAEGLHVAKVTGAGWAISSRGFNISTANKLLVLIDGRTVYSPVFGGVFWDAQDLVLEDVDRIEVTRGPGGSVWGANAVNGVINVVTRSASETHGTQALAAAGSLTVGLMSVRHGGRLGAGSSYRGYVKVRGEEAQMLSSGASAEDDSTFVQTGFRLDSDPTPSRNWSWTAQGDLYRGTSGLLNRSDTENTGGNLLGRWSYRDSDSSEWRVQTFVDRTSRTVPGQYHAVRSTFDVDMQRRRSIGTAHRLVFGAGFRASGGLDRGDGPGFFFEPERRTSTLASAFVQNETALFNDHLFVTLGSKLERNDFSGVEIQPTARIRMTLNPQHTLWGSVSRAVRMPTRFDTDLQIPGFAGRGIAGTSTFDSENVIALEAGYRARPEARVVLDATIYRNRYTDLRSLEPPVEGSGPFLISNGLTARTAGLELGGTLQAAEGWRIRGSYSYHWKQFGFAPEGRDITGGANEANDPAHIWWLRSYLSVGPYLEADAFLRHASSLPSPALDSYTELDVRVGVLLRPSWDVSIVGLSLLADRHLEFAAGTPLETLSRGILLRSAWRFP